MKVRGNNLANLDNWTTKSLFTQSQRESESEISLMFAIYSLIFFDFAQIFPWCKWTLKLTELTQVLNLGKAWLKVAITSMEKGSNSLLLQLPNQTDSPHNDNFHQYSCQAFVQVHSPTDGCERCQVCCHNSHTWQYDAQRQHSPP